MCSCLFWFSFLLTLQIFNDGSALSFSLQVTKGMFGARKKFVEFVEVVDNDFSDEGMYYNQPSMFPHRSDKDVSLFPDICTPLSLSPGDVLPGYLTPSRLLIFFFRCFHLPRHRRRVSCRNSVRVCTVHKVSVYFLYSSFLTCCIFWVD